MRHLFSYRRKYCFFYIFFYATLSFSQNFEKADSLLKILESNNLSKKEQVLTLRNVAFYHPNLNIALNSAKQSFKIAQEIKESLLQAEALEEISHIEHRLGNNGLSLQASLTALQIYESLNMLERQAASYSQLANNYMNGKNYDLAIRYLKKAKYIYSNSNNSQNYALTNLNLGEAYRLAQHLDSAATAFQQTLKLNKTLKNDIIQGYSQGNLAMVYTTQNKLSLARQNLNDAINILSPLKDYYSNSVYLAELGKVYNKEGKYKAAENKFLEALSMAKQAGLKEQIRDFSALLTSFYESQKQYPLALEYQKSYQVYQDSLVNKENIQKIEQLKAGYEIDKRESEIGLLNTINTNQKFWVITLAVGASLLLLFAYFLYRGNKRIKVANTMLSSQKIIITKREQEKTLLLKELNHRIKNNLQMISSLLNLQSHELKGHPAKEAIVAGKYRVEALSLVHKKLYQEDLDTRVVLREYVEELVLGLFYGYNASFKPDFKMDDINVSLDTAVPLALVINEIIVNALKYAYKNVDNPKLKIIMSQDNNYLDIQIIDNGIGFNTNEAEKNNSFGIKLIYSLIEQLEGVIKKPDSKHGTHWKMHVKLT
ncbi:histidine kinase dimerization/phosphoacceptor domain -containing protein [Flavivirga spongiicola]|uniref:histidine kinase n=1 Tax=Flavivirga spongiicola TaxID=421621 RepID=A0ABU7XU49_9FLAO|nr:histidine kinase dimerization/phosphoacceptor domain -containing protein [Flavivirga sp. MEBiC05379]MDO5978362.1 histidine kinase dimerization/phosphoacceptor domain -containing protein [Flavivirga sp. MEBiC05379]